MAIKIAGDVVISDLENLTLHGDTHQLDGNVTIGHDLFIGNNLTINGDSIVHNSKQVVSLGTSLKINEDGDFAQVKIQGGVSGILLEAYVPGTPVEDRATIQMNDSIVMCGNGNSCITMDFIDTAVPYGIFRVSDGIYGMHLITMRHGSNPTCDEFCEEQFRWGQCIEGRSFSPNTYTIDCDEWAPQCLCRGAEGTLAQVMSTGNDPYPTNNTT